MKKYLVLPALFIAGLFISENAAAQVKPDTTRKTATATAGAGTTTNAVTPTLDLAALVTATPDYSTAAAAIKAANLATALQAAGPYTIFAPNNAAFSKVPAGSLDSLMKDPVKLGALLKGHVVTGRYTKADIIKALTAGKGKATLTTLDGQTLTLAVSPTQTLQLTNSAGVSAEVTLYDLLATNGIVNGINGVLVNKK